MNPFIHLPLLLAKLNLSLLELLCNLLSLSEDALFAVVHQRELLAKGFNFLF
jgi:hypothetical protein